MASVNDEKPRARLNRGHYVCFQIFAIVLPPAIFFLCCVPHRNRWHDVRNNLVLLFVLWIPAVVHASLFLNDAYRASHSLEPRHFHGKRNITPPALQSALDKVRAQVPSLCNTASTETPPNAAAPATPATTATAATVATDVSQQGDDIPADAPSRPVSPAVSEVHTLRGPPRLEVPQSKDGRSIASASTSTRTVRSSQSYATSIFSRMSALPRHQAHKDGCRRCSLCTRCYRQQVRYREDHMQGIIPNRHEPHSQETHLEEAHHVAQCLCEACIDKKLRMSDLRDFERHPAGCVCEVCKPVKHKYPEPPERFPFSNSSQRSQFGALSHMMGY